MKDIDPKLLEEYKEAGAVAKRLMLAFVGLMFDYKTNVSVNALVTAAAFFCKLDGFSKEQFQLVTGGAWDIVSAADRQAKDDQDMAEKIALGMALGNKFDPPKEGGN